MYQDDEIKEIEFKMRVFPGESIDGNYSINLSPEDFQTALDLELEDFKHLITENKIILFHKRKNIRIEVAANVLSDPWALADFSHEIENFLLALRGHGLLRTIPKEKDNFIDDKPGRKKWELDGISIDDWAWEEVNIKNRNKITVFFEWLAMNDKAESPKGKKRKLSNKVNSFNYAISKTRKNRLKNN
jgi:hypothetical protein